MRPKKVKELLPIVAVEMGIPVETVEAVSKYFWAHTRQMLAEAPKLKVKVYNLGDFIIKHWLLEKRLEAKQRMFNGTKKSEASNSISVDILQLKRLQRLRTAELQRKEFIQDFKKTKTNDVKANCVTDLEE